MRRRIDSLDRLAILMHGELVGGWGKMGRGVLRYSEAEVVAVIDRDHEGGDLRTLTGIPRAAPIVVSSADALRLGATLLVIGVATPGGLLPGDWWPDVCAALEGGMSLVHGLHARLSDDPDLVARLAPGAWIWDVRTEPPELTPGTGAARNLRCRRVLTVGTDMAIGKMTASIELDREARRRGIPSRFVATGQIGICIAGDGVALDAVRVDFASGAVEAAVTRMAEGVELLSIEGQGSIVHPASTAWLPLIRGSSPTDLILVHRASATCLGRARWVPIPPLTEVAALYESVAAAAGALPPCKTRAIALNCEGLSDSEAYAATCRIADQTGLPTGDVLRGGAGMLLDTLNLTAQLPGKDDG